MCVSVWLVAVMVGEPPRGYRGYPKGPVWSSLNARAGGERAHVPLN